MTAPYYVDESVTLWHGDCLDVLRTLPDASVDSVVTDPPYGLEFMGKDWDRFGHTISDFRSNDGYDRLAQPVQRGARVGSMAAFQEWCLLWTVECLRVLKPGGHLLAFGGTRTWHRLACAVEDAGFEIRDSIAWLYGSGFPKSLNVERSIDTFLCVLPGRHRWTPQACTMPGDHVCPSTAEGRAHAGDGTALKPAFEPIVVGRKPLAGTVAANVLAHGTGALNVDGCRVPMSAADASQIESMTGFGVDGYTRQRTEETFMQGTPKATAAKAHDAGRWPTNVILDDSQADVLDAQSGTLTSGLFKPEHADHGKAAGTLGAMSGRERTATYGGDSGGASRFFPTFRYEAKAPTLERPTYRRDGESTWLADSSRKRCTICGRQQVNVGTSACVCPEPDFQPDPAMLGKVAHPTVKPVDLMRWLVRLVTPPGGLVLDPFAGSGTTAEACVVEGFRCVLIEREADYLPLIVARLSKPIAPVLVLGGAA